MTKTFLLEIGLEEVPAHLVTPSAEQLVKRTRDFLAANRLAFGDVISLSTPRRLAVQITDLADESAAIDEELRGPSIKVAKDEAGNWSKAALGFARGQGASADDLTERDGYVYLNKHVDGVAAAEILARIGDDVVAQMKFSTYMKWANFSFEYVRPIRWLIGLLDEAVLDFNVLDVQSGRVSRGHRFLSDGDVTIASATSYVDDLQAAFVLVDAKARKAEIRQQIEQLAADNNWTLHVDEDLLEEVNNIVEWPTAFAGNFAPEYLQVPDEVLITSMREHQRFFYVTDANGALLPHFISVRNGNAQHLDNVIAGNEKVLVARLEDAKFFFNEDQQHDIAYYMNKVAKLVFHAKIGSIPEHMSRAGLVADLLAKRVGADVQTADLARASEIYKFDLMTGMVGEFDELQGVMGEKYAKLFGENDAVAAAIREHYLPDSADGAVPATDLGAVLAVSDKLASILAFFAAGLTPSGSNDPYALRRAASGVVRILQAKNWRVALNPLLDDVIAALQNDAHGLPVEVVAKLAEVKPAVIEFLVDRVRQQLSDVRFDIVAAGTAGVINADLVYVAQRTQVLAAHADDADFRDIMEALTRVQNLAVKNPVDAVVDATLFENDAERALFAATADLDVHALEAQGAENVYASLATLQAPIADYFDQTMVMADNEAVKTNRLAQLNAINKLIAGLGDLREINVK
ncbi:MAG TPA: glycine--tRNA ligase subunit beta [Lactobacillaceae bacterium]|jgi:glycyl-tRNA synthetase beta chain